MKTDKEPGTRFRDILNRTWKIPKIQGRLQFRVVDVTLFWILISLIAVSLVADHPVAALVIAIAGGTMIGLLSVMGADPL